MGNKYSKDRLRDEIKSDVLTLTIGILDEFQEEWGYLWGGGRPGKNGEWVGGSENPTENEQRFREKWIYFRKYVLDNGNDVIRSLHDILSTYSIEWQRYRTNFIVNNQRRGQDES